MLSAFTASLLLITVSELGDKTFFIAAILAMRHPRRWVFTGAVSALALMTLLSVLVGQAATLLPPAVVKWAEISLFLLFGLKLLYQASQMSATAHGTERKRGGRNHRKGRAGQQAAQANPLCHCD